jgi:putative hydrolase of the HAD superfamily
MEIARRYSAIRTAQERLFPEAKDVLIALRAEGVRLGLLTNGAAVEQRSKVTRFDLTLLFDHINIEGETGLGKPEPETFQQAMRALGVKADQTWMVGDWLEFDVLPCHALGLTGIWIDRDGKGLPEGFPTCRVIQSLNELLDMKDTEAAHAEGKVHRT